ncbi:tyrosine-type recombinase/integrase [Deinococcus sp. NW-56]|uniref:tyrosine-type recombinase/integrase n=2 Tax=Bacteria TaxID=2 RepID=UPI000CF3AEB6|nr:tyrosine-type recombinase/integrase [Deinococcus sp. NW-56]
MTTDELWQQFFFHLQAKRRTKATLRYYATTRTSFGRFVQEGGLPQEAEALTVQHLRAFLRKLEADGLAPGGVHAHARALRALLTWAYREELLSTNPVKRLEMPTVDRQRLPAVSGEQVQLLLKTCRKGPQPLRDCALVLTLFDTGIRVQEAVNLQLSALLFERGLLRIHGKGNKERFVPIGARAMQALNIYLRRERRPAHAGVPNVFLSRSGQPLTKSGISIRLHKLALDIGVPRADCAPHTFRRGFAVEFLRNGGDVFTLQQILGHSSLEMTRRYVTFLDEDLKAAHLRFSPGDRL